MFDIFLLVIVAACSFVLPILLLFRKPLKNDIEYHLDLLENQQKVDEFEFAAVTSPMVPSQHNLTADQLEKMEKKRKNVLNEFLATEQTYVHCLNVLSSHFIIPIRKQQLIPQQTFGTIFNSIEIIKGVNETFLAELERVIQGKEYAQDEQEVKKSDTSKLASLLLHYAHSFKLYTAYISQFRLGQSTLALEKSNNKQLKTFLSQQQKRLTDEKNRITDLEGFLITPVQRLPRYRLLLEDLLKTIPPGEDLKNLEKATELIRQVANFCNEKEREFERQARFLMIRRELKYPELKPSRKYVGEEVGKGIQCTDGNVVPNKTVPPLVGCDIYLFNDVLVVRKKNASFWNTGIVQIGLDQKEACPQTGLKIAKISVVKSDPLSFSVTVQYANKETSITKFVCTDESQCTQLRDSIENSIH